MAGYNAGNAFYFNFSGEERETLEEGIEIAKRKGGRLEIRRCKTSVRGHKVIQ